MRTFQNNLSWKKRENKHAPGLPNALEYCESLKHPENLLTSAPISLTIHLLRINYIWSQICLCHLYMLFYLHNLIKHVYQGIMSCYSSKNYTFQSKGKSVFKKQHHWWNVGSITIKNWGEGRKVKTENSAIRLLQCLISHSTLKNLNWKLWIMNLG